MNITFKAKLISGFILANICIFITSMPVLANSDPTDPLDPQAQRTLLAWRVTELTMMARNIMSWIRENSPTLWIVFCASFAFTAVRIIKKLKKV